MSKKSSLEEQTVRALPSAEITEPSLLIRESLPESAPACPKTSIASSLRTKGTLVPLPVNPTCSVTPEGSRSGITERQKNTFLPWDWLCNCWKSYRYIDDALRVVTKSSYFKLNVRGKTDKERSNLIFSDFNPILLTCLRIIVGGECLSKHPQVPINDLLFELEALDTRTDAARLALAKENNEDGVIQAAEALGHEGLHNDDARKYLAVAVQQLESLLLLLKEEFKPVTERLKHAIARGHMPHDLLELYFSKGQKFYYLDGNGDPAAFRLMSTHYKDSDQTFTLNGDEYYWDGTDWVVSDLVRKFGMSEGPLIMADLLITKMTPEISRQLTERARKYISLAGVHHRLYRGRRIMVDRLAWNTFSYIHPPGVSNIPFPILRDRSKARANDDILPVPEEDIDLLPRCMPGFDLERQVWDFFDVDEVMPIKFNDNAWKHVVLEETSKTIIEEVVGEFDFRKDAMPGEENTGLVILLHGPSGTGKTATVEAIAEHFRRPLYLLPVGALPFDITMLGDMLTSRLDTARTWNAIILIEAGDILMQTEKQNLTMEEHIRISTILQFFQQHRCIVFVTARTACPIYASHFALTIQYPELDADSRQILWSNMLSSEGDNISRRDIEELSRVAVNGRAMRNIYMTAKALARSSKQPLSLHHLKTAAKTHAQVEGAGYHLYW